MKEGKERQEEKEVLEGGTNYNDCYKTISLLVEDGREGELENQHKKILHCLLFIRDGYAIGKIDPRVIVVALVKTFFKKSLPNILIYPLQHPAHSIPCCLTTVDVTQCDQM